MEFLSPRLSLGVLENTTDSVATSAGGSSRRCPREVMPKDHPCSSASFTTRRRRFGGLAARRFATALLPGGRGVLLTGNQEVRNTQHGIGIDQVDVQNCVVLRQAFDTDPCVQGNLRQGVSPPDDVDPV